MRILRIIAVALVSGVVGCILALFLGDYLTRLFHVSDFEGQRGYVVVFLCAPLGLVVGFIVGLVAGLLVKQTGLVGFLRAQGWSILTIGVIAGIVTGIPYLISDKPPKIDGKRLTLDFELRIPSSNNVPEEPDGYSIRVSLYANNRQNRYAFIDWNSIVRQPDQIMIPGNVELLTHSESRSLLASIGNEPDASQFLEVKVPASPRKKDENWSAWTAATQRADLSPVPEAERFSIRYRVRELD